VDDLIVLEGGNSDRLAKAVMARYDGPAYLRRAKQMELAIAALHQKCQETRHEMLHLVRLRLGRLLDVAGSWEKLMPGFLEPSTAEILRQLLTQEGDQQTVPEPAAASPGRIQHALQELCEAIHWFNLRWIGFLHELDLNPVNALITGYNRWYVLEKECAVGSPRVARQGFRVVPPITLDDLKTQYPPLPVPDRADARHRENA